MTLDPKFIPTLERLCQLKEEKKQADALSRKLDKEIKQLYVPIVDIMGPACSAVCKDRSTQYEVKYDPTYRTGISKENLSKLEAQCPGVFADFVETTESRTFKLKKIAS